MFTPETEFNDVAANPEKFGWLNFKDYVRQRDKWVKRDDEQLAFIDKGSTLLKRHVEKYKYFLEGYPADSVEKVESMAKDMGIPIREIVFLPEVMPGIGGQCEIHVKCFSKESAEKRKKWR